jgi:LysR family transcriptional regulator, glycine cleavage system transcriptional activator
MSKPTTRRKRRLATPGDAFRRLPLGSLRVFVAVAEHLSFTRAAAALGVTVSAASMQIQALEKYLGLPLLRRRGRLVELTADGANLLPKVRDSLASLQAALDAVRTATGKGPLAISTLSSFLHQWLLPRLANFEERFHGVDLRIHTSAAMVDFSRTDFHAAIRFGVGPWPGLHAEKLLDEWLVPVCQPSLLARLGGIAAPADLARYKLVHSPSEPWSTWFLGAGLVHRQAIGASFDDSLAVVRAAETGGGLALARWSLVADEVSNGRLAVAACEAIAFERCYFFVCPPKYRELDNVTVFLEWLRERAKLHPAPPVPIRGVATQR